jgi:hypothetical protein
MLSLFTPLVKFDVCSCVSILFPCSFGWSQVFYESVQEVYTMLVSGYRSHILLCLLFDIAVVFCDWSERPIYIDSIMQILTDISLLSLYPNILLGLHGYS